MDAKDRYRSQDIRRSNFKLWTFILSSILIDLFPSIRFLMCFLLTRFRDNLGDKRGKIGTNIRIHGQLFKDLVHVLLWTSIVHKSHTFDLSYTVEMFYLISYVIRMDTSPFSRFATSLYVFRCTPITTHLACNLFTFLFQYVPPATNDLFTYTFILTE